MDMVFVFILLGENYLGFFTDLFLLSSKMLYYKVSAKIGSSLLKFFRFLVLLGDNCSMSFGLKWTSYMILGGSPELIINCLPDFTIIMELCENCFAFYCYLKVSNHFITFILLSNLCLILLSFTILMTSLMNLWNLVSTNQCFMALWSLIAHPFLSSTDMVRILISSWWSNSFKTVLIFS